jgi:Rieske 2Fe-2S family protein
VYFYALFPNLLLSLHPDYVVAYTLWPIAPDRTLARCTWLFAAPDGNTEPWNPSGAIAFWDEANREDFEALALVQQGLSTARHRPGPYSRLESLAAAFDDHLLAVLDAERTPIAPTD